MSSNYSLVIHAKIILTCPTIHIQTSGGQFCWWPASISCPYRTRSRALNNLPSSRVHAQFSGLNSLLSSCSTCNLSALNYPHWNPVRQSTWWERAWGVHLSMGHEAGSPQRSPTNTTFSRFSPKWPCYRETPLKSNSSAYTAKMMHYSSWLA